MTVTDIREARSLVETVRAQPPSYDNNVRMQLRLADMLIRAVDEVERLEREHASKGKTDGR